MSLLQFKKCQLWFRPFFVSEGYHKLRLILGWAVLMGGEDVAGNEKKKKVSEVYCPPYKNMECKNVWTSALRNLGYEPWLTELKRRDVLAGEITEAQLQGGKRDENALKCSLLGFDFANWSVQANPYTHAKPCCGNRILCRLTRISLQEWGPETSGGVYTECK